MGKIFGASSNHSEHMARSPFSWGGVGWGAPAERASLRETLPVTVKRSRVGGKNPNSKDSGWIPSGGVTLSCWPQTCDFTAQRLGLLFCRMGPMESASL